MLAAKRIAELEKCFSVLGADPGLTTRLASNTSREIVSRLLKDFETRGLLKLSRGRTAWTTRKPCGHSVPCVIKSLNGKSRQSKLAL